MSKSCHFIFQSKNKIYIITINKSNIMKKKYQQYFHCLIACMLVQYPFWFSYQQNIATVLISVIFRGAVRIRGEAFIRRRPLFQCGYPKLQRLLERGYLRSGLIRGNIVLIMSKQFFLKKAASHATLSFLLCIDRFKMKRVQPQFNCTVNGFCYKWCFFVIATLLLKYIKLWQREQMLKTYNYMKVCFFFIVGQTLAFTPSLNLLREF